MPVEQGLPWHPVATGLAGQAIPFIVAASHAHTLPSPPFWFPVPGVLVASLGTKGTGHFCTCLQIYKLTCHWCLLGLFWGECGALLLFCFLGC